MKFAIAFLLCSLSYSFTAQTPFLQRADSLHKKRLIGLSTGIAVLGVGSNVLLSQIWYADYERTAWHTFDDGQNWMQVDKLGHAYAAYQFSSLVAKTYRWAGVKPKAAACIGAGVGWGYQFGIEMLDGYSSGWGFSWSDVTANTLGAGLFLVQELALKDQWIKFKFSYNESGLAAYRPSHLGASFPEKLLKDYNAQTYWLSFSPFYFSKNPNLPKWLAIAVGYGAHEKMVGDLDIWTASDGSRTFHAQREFILSLDVDVKQLPIKKRWLKMALSPFNTIKFPFPALVWQGNTLYAKRSY